MAESIADGGARGLDPAAPVPRAASGDVVASEPRYRLHAGRVHALCLRLTRDASPAEDCVPETFVRAWRALPRFEMTTRRTPQRAFGPRFTRRTRRTGCCGTLLAIAAGIAQAAGVPVDKRVAAAPDGTVAVSNVGGSLSIEGWERPEVHVTGSVGESVERVDVIREGSRTAVKVVLPRGASMRSGAVDLVVRMPATSGLEVSAVSAEVDSGRIAGAQRINAVSGAVEVRDATGPVEIRTVSGDISLRGGDRGGALRLTTVSGDLRADGVGGEIEATSVSGDMVLALGVVRALQIRSTSGDVELRAAPARGARLEVESVSGDLELALRAPGGLEVDAESLSGEIATCYGARGTASSARGPGKSLRGRRGAGEARLRVKTMSGDIQVCDR